MQGGREGNSQSQILKSVCVCVCVCVWGGGAQARGGVKKEDECMGYLQSSCHRYLPGGSLFLVKDFIKYGFGGSVSNVELPEISRTRLYVSFSFRDTKRLFLWYSFKVQGNANCFLGNSSISLTEGSDTWKNHCLKTALVAINDLKNESYKIL